MSFRSTRRVLAPVLVALLLSVSAAACGDQVAPTAGASGAPTTAPAPPSSTSGIGEGSAASTVDGLSAGELREAVEAPDVAGRSRSAGPVAQPVRLASGAMVWRVRIPGRFPVRSARVVVSVGGRPLGEGVPGSHLQGLIAVTRDPKAIVSGAAVTYRWSGGPTVDAGRLVVVR